VFARGATPASNVFTLISLTDLSSPQTEDLRQYHALWLRTHGVARRMAAIPAGFLAWVDE
jgi:hypothetical protein